MISELLSRGVFHSKSWKPKHLMTHTLPSTMQSNFEMVFKKFSVSFVFFNKWVYYFLHKTKNEQGRRTMIQYSTLSKVINQPEDHEKPESILRNPTITHPWTKWIEPTMETGMTSPISANYQPSISVWLHMGIHFHHFSHWLGS